MRALKNRFLAACMTAALCGAAVPAAAQATFDFSYTTNAGNTFSGVLTGTSWGNGNDFTVTGIQSLAVNGTNVGWAESASYPVESYDYFAGEGTGLNGNGSAVVTVNGTYLDLVAIATDGTAFDFLVGDNSAQYYFNGDIGLFLTADFEGDSPYSTARWSAEIVGGQAVPEPDSLALLAACVPALLAFRRRRAV